MLMCFGCWEVFDQRLLTGPLQEEMWCPIKSCGNMLVDIDESILPIIQTLNAKGYFTLCCCSGHFCDNDRLGWTTQYVAFDKSVKKKHLGKLPEGFVAKNGDGGTLIIRNKIKNEDPLALHIDILDSLTKLASWADGLPDLYVS